MKKIITLIYILTISLYSFGQCGVIILNNQLEVNQFPANYPNCLEAALIISGPSVIDLSPLSQVSLIINLEISNTSLVNLNGLENNTQVPGFIRIFDNNELINIDALMSTSGSGFQLTIAGNSKLQNINGLVNVSELRQVGIINNPELENLDGIENVILNHPEAELSIINNDNLQSFPAFDNVLQISVLTITDNFLVPVIDGFDNFMDFSFNFSFPTLIINNNASITSINGFSSLQNSLMDIQFNNNDNLKSITGFDLIADGVKNMSIQMNLVLDDVSFCDNIDASSFEVVVIRNNPTLSLCNSLSLCDYAQSNPSVGAFLLNDCGCSSLDEVLDICNGVDPCDCGDPVVDILEEFYNSTNGNQWTNNTGWLVDCDYCNWFGVTCDANQNVIVLNLQNNNLTGQLPQSICQLGFLQNLILGENAIGGQIPACIGGMQSLSNLSLNANNFSGPIPDFFNTPNLNVLQLGGNDLTGSLPASLGNLPLQAFSVSDNDLSGCFDPNLSNLCKPTIFQISINPGNNFEAGWTDFCTNGDGACATDCCGDAKIIGSINEEGGGVFKEVNGIRLLLSTTILGSDTYAVITKIDNNNDVVWSRRITEASQFIDFTLNEDGNILVVGRTTPVEIGEDNLCIMGIINGINGAVISMKKHAFFGRQTFSRILKHPNPKDPAFPYYIVGVENGTANNTNANDDVIMLNVGEQLQVNWSSKYIKSNDNQLGRDIIGLFNGDVLIVGDEDGTKGVFVKIDGGIGDVVSVMETADNRSFFGIMEVSGGNFISVGRSGSSTQNQGMLCYHDSNLSVLDAIHFDGTINFFYSISETSPGTFIAAGLMLNNKTVLVEFTIPTGTIQIQNMKYLDHDGGHASRANINYSNGKLLYTEDVVNHSIQFGATDLLYASLNTDLSDDCLVDTMFTTVSDAFTLSLQTLMMEPLSVDAGQNMAIGIFDYDQNDACQAVSISKFEDIEINVYPNPSHGVFTIEADEMANVYIAVFDITGRQIKQELLQNGRAIMDLSDQNSGLYIIRILDKKSAYDPHKIILTK